jgi:hypothetical protein
MEWVHQEVECLLRQRAHTLYMFCTLRIQCSLKVFRPGHLRLHSFTLLLGQIALTQPRGVLGHCLVKKQMIVPLSANQMEWCIAAECCGSHAG